MAMRCFCTLALLAAHTLALPSKSITQARSISGSTLLNVLCIGDSITVGVGSDASNGPDRLQNGYRLDLYDKLTSAGINANFIGSQVSGTNNPEPNMEGYGGYTIQAILDALQTAGTIYEAPNLVLIHAGTNDDDLPSIADGAAARLATLIDYVLCADANAVVLVAELVSNTYNQTSTDILNSQVPDIVGSRYMNGFRIRVVDMTMVGLGLKSDDLHPNPAGYAVMADQWYQAIMGIPDDWWKASQSSTSSGTGAGSIDTCDRNSISFNPLIGGRSLLQGFHANGDTADPPSQPESTAKQWSPGYTDKGIVAIGAGYGAAGVSIVDLNGDGHADYIWTNSTTGSEGAVHAWLGNGQLSWVGVNHGDAIAFGRPGTSYTEFADLDGDKLPELIYVADGMFRIYKNTGQLGDVWGWSELLPAEDQLNYIFVNSAPFHWFADFTGDGLADLMVDNNNGVLDLYINQGSDGNGGFTWRQCKAVGIATDQPVWADIDGDGKADYIAVDTDGGASGWLNGFSGGCSLNWNAINGRTPKSLALGTGAGSSAVRWADMTGDGKADYLTVAEGSGAIHLYPNIGSKQPPDNAAIGGFAAAARLADMDGDGVDDYASVTTVSGLAVTLNGGQSGSDGWTWAPQANANVIALGFPDGGRHQSHLADMNGDGRMDYVYVDDDTGALHCYLNMGKSNSGGGWSWNIMGEIAIGVGGVGKGVRLADFDGDGRADYIYLDLDGTARVWRNAGTGDNLSGWVAMNGGAIAAIGVGASRQDIQFADVDGDGLADYIWIHPDTGDMQVWYNLWDGKGFGWANGGTLLPGQGYPSQAVRFGRIGTSGRYDLAVLDEGSGAMRVWANTCSNTIGKKSRPIAGKCGTAPEPTKATPEPAPVHSPSPTALLGCAWDDTRDFCQVTSLCDTMTTYSTFADMDNALSSIPDECQDYIALDTMQNVLDGVMAEYDSANDGYDAVFGYYQEYMKDFIPSAIDLYMSSSSAINPGGGDAIKFFQCSCVSGDCSDLPVQQCPYTDAQIGGDTTYTVNIKLTDSDGFWGGLAKKYGILEPWVKFGTAEIKSSPSQCSPNNDCERIDKKTTGYPQIADNLVIPNPKDFVTKALSNITAIQNGLLAAMVDLDTGNWGGSGEDLVQAYSLPVLMLDQSVASMEAAKSLGQQEKHDKQVELALDILTGIFAVIPFADEFAPLLGLVRGYATLISTLVNVGTTIFQTVEDPSSGPLQFLSLFSAGLGRTEDVAKVAKARRALSADDVKSLGDRFKKQDDDFQKAITPKCDAT